MIDIEKNSVFPTLVVLIVSATIGGLMATGIGLVVSFGGVLLSGPLGWLIYGPALLASASIAFTYALIITPLWALGGGLMFANGMSGKGNGVSKMGITLFSDGHPIAISANAMAERLGLPPVPFIGWYDSEDINAFAMGTDPTNALIGLSKGAIENLTTEELDAVIGHELAHIANNDMARMTYARGVQEALTFFLIFRGLKKMARWLFTPVSEITIMKFSRDREFTADAIGAKLTSPEAMAEALQGIRHQQATVNKDDPYEAVRFSGWSTKGLFHTHPPLQTRIAALEAMAKIANAEHQAETEEPSDLTEAPKTTDTPLPEDRPTNPAITPLATPIAPAGEDNISNTKPFESTINGLLSFGA